MSSREIKQCPYCGSADGYYTKATLRHRYFYLFSGEPNGESEPEIIRGSKNPYVHCANCNRIIGRYEKLFANSERKVTE